MLTTPAVNTQPAGVAVGDVNNDGKPDVVTANYSANTLGILLGNGTGGFTLQSATPATDVGPQYVTLADVNKDGNLDALTANGGANALSVLLGNGVGSFTLQTNTPLHSLYLINYGLAVGDVNGDTNPDIVIANSNTTLGILLGNGLGSFTVQANAPSTNPGGTPASLPPHHPVLVDVNSDGKLDVLATTHNGAPVVSVLLGNGTGGFTLQANPPTLTGALFGPAVGDVNGDGRPDLVTVDNVGGRLSVLLGTGTGAFTLSNTYVLGSASILTGVALGDVSGDGKLDILTTASGTNMLYVLLGNGTGAFGTPVGISAGTNSLPNAVALSDVNGDGKLDVLTANRGSSTVGVLLNTSVITATSTNNVPALAGQVDLYPNPATGQVAIELPVGLSRQLVTASLVDALGRVVREQQLPAGQASHTLLLTDLAMGVYAVHLRTELGTVVKKLVVD